MMYVLNLDENKRVLSICKKTDATPENSTFTTVLPEGDCTNYLYANNEYIYEPLPEKESPESTPEEKPTSLSDVQEQIDAILVALAGGGAQ